MEWLFWGSALFVGYVYAGYPLLLAGWARVAARPVRKRAASDERPWPSVSVIVAAHNEAARLPARVTNLLDQKYPGPLEIVVVSDGSNDATRAALAPFADRIRLVELPRGGKPLALNAGVSAASGDILLFADARQRFSPGAIRAMVENFDDPAVGGATGELVLDCEIDAKGTGSTIGEGVGLYWTYEKWLRRNESTVWSTLGATGAIYALRRELWQPLPAATLLDDVLAPMRAVLDGKRVVFEERARAFDQVAANGSAESRRKTRTLAGNYQILAIEPRLLLPFVNPVWAQYLSHKLARLLVPWALVAALVSSALLAATQWTYAVALILQLGFYGLAALGGLLESRERGNSADEVRTAESSATLPARPSPHIPGGSRAKAG
jgi:cellulose synthase/poly-beta-1,6-N-acetylglucosamine synthase-like glycosyltransferase